MRTKIKAEIIFDVVTEQDESVICSKIKSSLLNSINITRQEMFKDVPDTMLFDATVCLFKKV